MCSSSIMKGMILQGLDIIIFAGIAVFFILRIMGVLGQRSEEEETQDSPRKDNLIEFQRKYQQSKKKMRDAKKQGINLNEDDSEEFQQLNNIEPIAGNSNMMQGKSFEASLEALDIKPKSKMAKDLKKIADKMSDFEPTEFLQGAEQAFEMILHSYAQAERQTLKDLLSKEIYKMFDDAIKQYETSKQRLQLTVLAIQEVSFVAAQIANNEARVTVRIVSEQNSVLYDGDENIIEGDKKSREEITDIWTFSKSINSRNPNWYLAATGSEV